jgi:hypothetical protein
LAGQKKRAVVPRFVCNLANGQCWPAQPQQFYDQLDVPKLLVDFMVAQGENRHCERIVPGLRSQRVYDWLDTTLKHGA